MYEQFTGSTPRFINMAEKLHGQAPKPNHIYFTEKWPGGMGWVSDKYFEITETKPLVSFVKSYILPVSDYKNLDLSNATSGLNLYPETTNRVHEILVGFKAGNYVVQIDVPNGTPLTRLPESSMIPSLTDASLKYLNAKNPEESPAYASGLKFWAVKDMDAIVLRPVIPTGVDYEKVTITFTIAKHVLTEIPPKQDARGQPLKDACGRTVPPVPVFDTIRYISEMRSE